MVDQHVPSPAPALTPTVLGAGTPPRSGPPSNEGHTVAAWTTVAIVLVGAVVVALGIALSLPWLAWVGAGVIVVGPIVGGVLRSLGHGQSPTQAAGSPASR
jgi:hypothetical protein